jgi:hypothetical protein
MNKTITVGLGTIILVIASATALFFVWKAGPKDEIQIPSNLKSLQKEGTGKTQEKTIVIPAEYVSATGTVEGIDTAKKALTFKNEEGKSVVVTYSTATTIYGMKDGKPEAKTENDIRKGEDISVQYDTARDNAATSIMVGGKWAKI